MSYAKSKQTGSPHPDHRDYGTVPIFSIAAVSGINGESSNSNYLIYTPSGGSISIPFDSRVYRLALYKDTTSGTTYPFVDTVPGGYSPPTLNPAVTVNACGLFQLTTQLDPTTGHYASLYYPAVQITFTAHNGTQYNNFWHRLITPPVIAPGYYGLETISCTSETCNSTPSLFGLSGINGVSNVYFYYTVGGFTVPVYLQLSC
jgi:hypothetical protein